MRGRRGQSPRHLKADYIRSLLCGGQRGWASGVGWEAAGVTGGVTTEEGRKWWGGRDGAAHANLPRQRIKAIFWRYSETHVIWDLARHNLSLLWCWLVCALVSNNSRFDCWDYHNNCSCSAQNVSVLSVVILSSVDCIIVVCSHFSESSSSWDNILIFRYNIFLNLLTVPKCFSFLHQVFSPRGVKYFCPQEAFCPVCHSRLRLNHLEITQHPGIRHDYQLSPAGPI